MKTYTQEELDSLINELKAELPDLIKSEGKSMQSFAAKEGGNGTEPVKASMAKADEPVAKPADDESSTPAPSASADSAPASDAPPDASPEAAPADAAPSDGQSPSPDQAQGSEMSLEQAYGALSDEELHAHWEALKAIVMQRMPQGGGMDDGSAGVPAQGQAPQGAPAPAAAPDAAAMDAAGSASPASASAVAPPPENAVGKNAMMGYPMARSEKEFVEKLQKSEDRVTTLETQLNGLTQLLEDMIQPKQKAATSMAQVLLKSEAERPQPVQYSKADIKKKLSQAAATPDLKKSDRELINRYLMVGDIKVTELEHLLK